MEGSLRGVHVLLHRLRNQLSVIAVSAESIASHPGDITVAEEAAAIERATQVATNIVDALSMALASSSEDS